MELCKPKSIVDRKTEALKKIYKAVQCMKPVIEGLGITGELSLLQMGAKIPKVMKGWKQNQAIMEDVFSENFMKELEELANENPE